MKFPLTEQEKKKRAGLLPILRRLRETASFTNCGFSDIDIPLKNGTRFSVHFPFELPCDTDTLTGAIRESTRIYRETWVLPLINDLILWAEGKKTSREIRREHCL